MRVIKFVVVFISFTISSTYYLFLTGPETLENGEVRTIYSCHLCQKQFGTQRLLREHCRRHVMNHKCKYCAVTVDSPSALKRHVAAVHAKCRLYTCCYCGHR